MDAFPGPSASSLRSRPRKSARRDRMILQRGASRAVGVRAAAAPARAGALVLVGDALEVGGLKLGVVHLPGLLANAFGMSRSEARRLIDQGAVSLDEQTLGADEHDVAPERLAGVVLRVGKRRFRRLRAV